MEIGCGMRTLGCWDSEANFLETLIAAIERSLK